VFTLNNYGAGEENGTWLPDCEYFVIGQEVGESGTPHLQGYCVFMDRYRLAQIKKAHAVCDRCHWEPQSQFSTPKQASDYCKKDKLFVEHGEWYIAAYDDPHFPQSSDTEDYSSFDEEELSEDEDLTAQDVPKRSKSVTIASPPAHLMRY